jgi:hypothetical protein
MRYADLIRAVLDGKIIQFRGRKTDPQKWLDFDDGRRAIMNLASEGEYFEYRIKPEPVADKVWYSTVNDWQPLQPLAWANNARERGCVPIKVTIKTDDNGVETRSVELL